MTYLIDEAFNVGKGANSIISMLHHFFEAHGMGECSVHLHADNCTGQNKNWYENYDIIVYCSCIAQGKSLMYLYIYRYMMYYLMWRVLTGLHEEVKISFLPVGHTTKVGDLDDIANCVSLSSFVNAPQLVGSLHGSVFIKTYNWSEHFEEHIVKTALKGISQKHHFRFASSSPGAVFVKSVGSNSERKINLLKNATWNPSAHELPPVVVPSGLSRER